jgi:hypothetical protein
MRDIMNRSDHKPLDQPEEIYAILSSLAINEPIPPQVRIYDYDDGTIPSWRLYERECDHLLQVLTLIDESTIVEDLFGMTAIAVEVFACSTKILAAPIYKYSPGCTKRRDRLGDIRQHARQWNERHEETEEEVA